MKSKITVSWLLALTLLLMLPLGAEAQTKPKDALVNYWYKVITVENKIEGNKEQLKDLEHLSQQLDSLIMACEKSKNQLQSIKIDPVLANSLASSHQQRIEAVSDIVGALKDLQDFSTGYNPLSLMSALGKVQKANEKTVESNEGLLKACHQYLSANDSLSARESLVLYWAETTEKEVVLNEALDKLLKTCGKIMLLSTKKENSPQIEQQALAALGDLEQTLTTIYTDLKGISLTGPLASQLKPIHQAKLKSIKGSIDLLHMVQEASSQKGKANPKALQQALTNQGQQLSAATSEYREGFMKLVEKYQD